MATDNQARKRPKRRWCQFSLRTMLLMITLASAFLGWRVHQARQQERAVAIIRSEGGSVRYDYGGTSGEESTIVQWIQQVLGVDMCHDVVAAKFGITVGGEGDYIDPYGMGNDEFRKAFPQIRALVGLERLEFSLITPRDSDLMLLQDLHCLTHIKCCYVDITDHQLKYLAPLANLRKLVLVDTLVTLQGVSRIRRALPNCQVEWHPSSKLLKYTWCGVSDLAVVEGLSDLQHLCLNYQVIGARLAHLQGLTNLQTLELANSQVSDAGLAHLKGLTNLQSLDLRSTSVSNVGLAHLQLLTNLRTLNLCDTQVTDDGLVHLNGLTNLQTLKLCDTQVTDDGLAHLKGLTNLQSLDLRSTSVSNDGLAHLQVLTNLRTLNLCDTQVTDDGLVHLNGLTNLQSLDLRRIWARGAGLKQLQEALPNCNIIR